VLKQSKFSRVKERNFLTDNAYQRKLPDKIEMMDVTKKEEAHLSRGRPSSSNPHHEI